MARVSKTSLVSCFILYFVASLFGYLTFYNYVQSDLLLTYNHSDPTNPLTLVVRVCVLIGVMLTLPLTHFPVRMTLYYWPVYYRFCRHERRWIFLFFPRVDSHGNATWVSCSSYSPHVLHSSFVYPTFVKFLDL